MRNRPRPRLSQGAVFFGFKARVQGSGIVRSTAPGLNCRGLPGMLGTLLRIPEVSGVPSAPMN
jgi:hypothetical protein